MTILKQYDSIRLRSIKLKIAFTMLIILGLCFVLRFTPAIDIYWINLATALVVSNWLYIFIISFLLIALHIVELKRYREILEKEDKKYDH